ncbi:hypothetical protein BDZ97DRAFT_1918722 [Flammula alnicola]|nr:hypothetical protein BDZ97DRAFT_1918722 [Flammula alnicola]
MVLQNLRPTNFAKDPDTENTPPSTSSHPKGLVSRLQDASRRRRARTSGMPARNPKYHVDQAKRRSNARPKTSVRFIVTTVPTLADVEMADAASSSSLRPRSYPISLPKELARPEFKDISSEALLAVEPSLEETDLQFLRDSLESLGPELMQSLANVKVNPVKDRLPKELTVLAHDMTAILPTHMLAVFGRPSPSSSGSVPSPRPRKVTLFPVHSLVLLAHCANLPKPPSALPVPLTGQQEVQLPIWSLCLPSPLTYPQLSTYLYTKQIDHILKSFLPCSPPSTLMQDPSQILAFATHLSATFTIQALTKYALTVHGLWQNVCALGIFDDNLWDAMDVMWKSLLTALAIATGEPSLMLSPQTNQPPTSS